MNPDESHIVEDYLDAWLDEQFQSSSATCGEQDDGDNSSAALSVWEKLARAAHCAELLGQATRTADRALAETRTTLPGDTTNAANAVKRALALQTGPPASGLRLPWDGPAQIGRFRILHEVGRGRFGVVYRAQDSRLDRDVAIKVARPEVTGRGDLADRFLREAATAAGLDHPGIVRVHEAGTTDGFLYYVMPFCDGENLAQWLASQKSPVDQHVAADIVRQVAQAIHAGHSKGIVHRDLKPANIMLVPKDDDTNGCDRRFQPKILDFGLSRSLEAELQDTRSSMIIGTPLYMSPEQARQLSFEVGPASDIFALGAILYELLTGTAPFAAETLPEVIERLRECEPVSPSRERRDVDSRLETICLKCLRQYPNDRYATAQDLADDLQRFLEDAPIAAQRATVVDHLRWWARKPQRVRDAGLVLVLMNVAIPTAMLVSSLIPLFVPDSPIAVMSVADLLRSNAPTAIGGLGVAWLGLKVLKGSHWALALATLAAAAQWVYCNAILLFGAAALAEYDGNPLAKLLVHLLLWFLFGFELAFCLAALYGQRLRNRSIANRCDARRGAPHAS